MFEKNNLMDHAMKGIYIRIIAYSPLYFRLKVLWIQRSTNWPDTGHRRVEKLGRMQLVIFTDYYIEMENYSL
jgi:hypothetical protein